MKSNLRLALLSLALVVLNVRADPFNNNIIIPRQIFDNPRPRPQSPVQDPPVVTPADPVTPQPSTPPASLSVPPLSPAVPSPAVPSPGSSQPASSSSPVTPSSQPASLTTPPPTPSPQLSLSVSLDAQSSEITITNTIIPSVTNTAPSQSAAPNNTPSKSDSGLGTGSIIGLSVAGGVAVLGIVAFFIWKFTRKRSTSDFDDSEAIKWPELNAHSGSDQYALPTKSTGRAGFETSPTDLSRTPSVSSGMRGGAAAAYPAPYTMAAGSVSDVYGADPYHVPAFPHNNPNVPPMAYHDDPNAAAQGAFYDPYSGPVPGTIYDPDGPPSATLATTGGGNWGPQGGEAFPMTQINQRSRSPGPGMAYDTGRGSPTPGVMGRTSPGPAMAYGASGAGRQSPGPAPAYSQGYGMR